MHLQFRNFKYVHAARYSVDMTFVDVTAYLQLKCVRVMPCHTRGIYKHSISRTRTRTLNEYEASSQAKQ